jgi:anti-sigma-K factor RskA
MSEINEQMKNDAAAFVLGALPEIEAQAFRREIMRDCELGRYVESLEHVGDVMLAAAPPVEVPDSLGMAIMAEARRDIEVQDLITSPRAGSVAAPKKQSFFDRLMKPAVGLAVAAVLVVGAFGLGGGFTSDNNSGEGTVTASLFQPAAAKDVSGVVKPISGGSDGAVVRLNGLEPNIGSDTYELWVAHGDKFTRSSTFSVDSAGRGTSVVPEDLSGADAVLVTREPAGGSDQPTGDVLAKATIS